MKIVINRCFGGFSLSEKAEAILEGWAINPNQVERNNPILIQVVQDLGDEANGRCAELGIIEIPDDVDWEISEYDGREHVCEKHRTWY